MDLIASYCPSAFQRQRKGGIVFRIFVVPGPGFIEVTLRAQLLLQFLAFTSVWMMIWRYACLFFSEIWNYFYPLEYA